MTTTGSTTTLARLRAKSLSDWRAAIERRAALSLRTRTIEMRNRRPIASITFDDCPASATTIGARILENHGVRGTFYICGALAGRAWEDIDQFAADDVARLIREGHEIGCHTFGHNRATHLSRRAIKHEIAANQSFVDRLTGNYVMSTFAYPYGAVGLASKHLLQRHFTACRSIEPGIDRGIVDLGHVKANLLGEHLHGVDCLKPLIGQTVAANGWLNLFTHDISDDPSPFGCRPAALGAIIEALLAAGIEILPVKDAVERITNRV